MNPYLAPIAHIPSNPIIVYLEFTIHIGHVTFYWFPLFFTFPCFVLCSDSLITCLGLFLEYFFILQIICEQIQVTCSLTICSSTISFSRWTNDIWARGGVPRLQPVPSVSVGTVPSFSGFRMLQVGNLMLISLFTFVNNLFFFS